MDDIANRVCLVEEVLFPPSTTNARGRDRVVEESGGVSQEKIENAFYLVANFGNPAPNIENFLRHGDIYIYIYREREREREKEREIKREKIILLLLLLLTELFLRI